MATTKCRRANVRVRETDHAVSDNLRVPAYKSSIIVWSAHLTEHYDSNVMKCAQGHEFVSIAVCVAKFTILDVVVVDVCDV